MGSGASKPSAETIMRKSVSDRLPPSDAMPVERTESGKGKNQVEQVRKRNIRRHSELLRASSETLFPTEKSLQTVQLIKSVLCESFILSRFTMEQQAELVNKMYRSCVEEGEYLLHRGDVGQLFYVVEEGEITQVINDSVSLFGPGTGIGDEFLINPSESQFDLQVSRSSVVWILSTFTYQQILQQLENTNLKQNSSLLSEIPLFSSLTQSQLQSISEVLTIESFQNGEHIIHMGDVGDKFYIIKSGQAKFVQNGVELRILGSKSFFGEIALLQKITRTLDVLAIGITTCFVIKKGDFDRLFGSLDDVLQYNMKFRLLSSTPVLSPLHQEEKEQLAGSVDILNYVRDDYIVREGEIGDRFYIIEKGEVVATKTKDGATLVLRHMADGDYFGERALFREEKRSASIQAVTDVTVLSIKRDDFIKYLGNYESLLERNKMEDFMNSIEFFGRIKLPRISQEQLITSSKNVAYHAGDVIVEEGDPPSNFYIVESGAVHLFSSNPSSSPLLVEKGHYFGEVALLNSEPQKYKAVAHESVRCLVLNQTCFFQIVRPLLYTLSDLSIESVIGCGGYAVVKKVHPRNNSTSVFALKVISKSKLSTEHSRQTLLNEKNLVINLNHPFITRLLSSYQDHDFVYLLMEYISGGDLRTFLLSQPDGRVDEAQARFISAIVVSGLEYLHSRQIVYRDLKPENLMLTNDGYVKICDFGNAKEVVDRTFTVCGTPDYMAPELWLNKGHGIPCDYWAYGVLVYELLCGKTPFEEDPELGQKEQINRILKCRVSYPSYFPPAAIQFIRSFLREKPSMKNKAKDVKEHPFLAPVDFAELLLHRVAPPFVPDGEYISECCTLFENLSDEDIRTILIDPNHMESIWINNF